MLRAPLASDPSDVVHPIVMSTTVEPTATKESLVAPPAQHECQQSHPVVATKPAVMSPQIHKRGGRAIRAKKLMRERGLALAASDGHSLIVMHSDRRDHMMNVSVSNGADVLEAIDDA
jgi:hypothetical protein